MKLSYLPANCAWVFLFGDAIINLSGEPMLFTTRVDAWRAANRHGLHVARDGSVSVKE